MEDNLMFEIAGTKEDIALALRQIGVGDKEGAKKILDFLCCHSDILDESEIVEICSEHKDGMMSLTLFDSSLYVNIKTTTIVMVAFLLDITLTGGVSALSLSLLGVNNRAFARRIQEKEGEKCIVKETLMRKPQTGNINILDRYEEKCQCLDSQCKFRNMEQCNCTHDDIVSIYENLSGKNIFKLSTDRRNYIYQW